MISHEASRRRVRSGRPPAVVFCNGLGMPMELWEPVIALLPQDLAIVTFDRPAHSPYAGDDLDAQLDELDDILADVTGPLVLVGHSYGGVLAEGYARRRPMRVQGLVLVDPALPSDYASTTASREVAAPGLPWWRNAAIRLSDVEGLQPLLSWLASTSMVATATRQGDFTATVEGLPAGAIEQIVSVANVTRAMLDDHHLPIICRTLLEDRQAAGPLHLPVTVLVGAAGPRVWPTGQPGWAARQREQLTDISTRGTLTELPGAHLLMLDCPDDVANAIDEVAASG
jgi:pimeloyl-ACP methyl ester carboxylesterase